jgi:hypothetical protein
MQSINYQDEGFGGSLERQTPMYRKESDIHEKRLKSPYPGYNKSLTQQFNPDGASFSTNESNTRPGALHSTMRQPGQLNRLRNPLF